MKQRRISLRGTSPSASISAHPSMVFENQGDSQPLKKLYNTKENGANFPQRRDVRTHSLSDTLPNSFIPTETNIKCVGFNNVEIHTDCALTGKEISHSSCANLPKGGGGGAVALPHPQTVTEAHKTAPGSTPEVELAPRIRMSSLVSCKGPPTGHTNPPKLSKKPQPELLSGMQIRRRPPSVPRQPPNASGASRAAPSGAKGNLMPRKSPFMAPLGSAEGEGVRENSKGVANDFACRSRSTNLRRFNGRIDASPARPPRGNRRRQPPTLQNHSEGSANDLLPTNSFSFALPMAQSGDSHLESDALQRPSVVAQEARRPGVKSAVYRLTSFHPVIAPTRADCEGVLQCYLWLCEELQEAPNESWVATLSRTLHNPPPLQRAPSEATTTALGKGIASMDNIVGGAGPTAEPHSVPPEMLPPQRAIGLSTLKGNAKHGSSVGDTLGKAKDHEGPSFGCSTTSSIAALKQPKAAGTKGGGLRDLLLGPPGLKAPTPASWPKQISTAAEVCIKHVMEYCEQRLRPFHSKMESFHQYRVDVRLKLEKFLAEVSNTKIDSKDPSFDRPQEVERSEGQHNLLGFSQNQKSNSTSSARESYLQQRAQILNGKLQELQRSIVLLLLYLEECAKEARKPLGSAWNGSHEDSLTKMSAGSDNVHDVSLSLTDPSTYSKIESNDKLGQIMTKNIMYQDAFISSTSPSAPDRSGNGPRCSGESSVLSLPTMINIIAPSGFARFVSQQEREILEELNLIKDAVRNALAQNPLIHIAEMTVFETPFFFLSATSDAAKNHFGTEPTNPLSVSPKSPYGLTSEITAPDPSGMLANNSTDKKNGTQQSRKESPRLRTPGRKSISMGKVPNVLLDVSKASCMSTDSGTSLPSKVPNADRFPSMTPTRPTSGKPATKKSDAKSGPKDKHSQTTTGMSNKPKKRKNRSVPRQHSVYPQFVVRCQPLCSDEDHIISLVSNSSGVAVDLLFRGYLGIPIAERSRPDMSVSCRKEIVENGKPKIEESPHASSTTTPGGARRRSLSMGNMKKSKQLSALAVRSVSSQPKDRSLGVGGNSNNCITSSRSDTSASAISYTTASYGNFIFCTQLERALSVWGIINSSFSSSSKLTGEVTGLRPPLPPTKVSPSFPTLNVGTPLNPSKSPTLMSEVFPNETTLKGSLCEGLESCEALIPTVTASEVPLSPKALPKVLEEKKQGKGLEQQRLVALHYIREFLRHVIHRYRLRNALAGAAQVGNDLVKSGKKTKKGVEGGKAKRSVNILTLEEEHCALQRKRREKFLELLAEGRLFSVKPVSKRLVSPSTESGRILSSPDSPKVEAAANEAPVLTSRERLQRGRESRKGHALSKPSAEPSPIPQATSPLKRRASRKVVPLPLLEHGISMKSITSYNRENEGLMVSLLNRLLGAPLPLLYMLGVLCERYPLQPPMAYALPKKKPVSPSDAKEDADTLASPLEQTDVENTTRLTDPNASPDPQKQSQQARERRRLTEQQSGIFLHVPFSLLRPLLVCGGGLVTRVGGPVKSSKSHPKLPVTDALPADNPSASSSLRENLSNEKYRRARILCSVRYTGYVDSYELRHASPVSKPFTRPFERWSIANNLVRRISCAAAIYAWKIIFSHTPHDDSKQACLRTAEERMARLERVRYRNQMILECYDAHSEREWLREACKDLSFVGHIWVPRDPLEKRDAHASERCRQTFDFVEKFILQCFPTLESVAHIPGFLVGAGIFFLLKEVLNCDCDYEKTFVDAELFAQSHPGMVVSDSWLSQPSPMGTKGASFTTHQLQAIQVYEQVVILSQLVNWFSTDDKVKYSNRSCEDDSFAGHANNATLAPPCPTSDACGLWTGTKSSADKLDSKSDKKAETDNRKPYSFEFLLECTPGRCNGAIPTTPASLAKILLARLPLETHCRGVPQKHVDMHPLKVPKMERLGGEGWSMGSGVRLVHVPQHALRGWANATPNLLLKEREIGIRSALSAWFHSSSSKKNVTERSGELLVLYPSHFLKSLSTRLAYLLLGETVSLDMCEDLEYVED